MSNRFRVRFENVGREKKTWEADVANGEDMFRSAVASGALRSSGIDVDLDMETGEGHVIVGGFRPVGRIVLVGGPADTKKAG